MSFRDGSRGVNALINFVSPTTPVGLVRKEPRELASHVPKIVRERTVRENCANDRRMCANFLSSFPTDRGIYQSAVHFARFDYRADR